MRRMNGRDIFLALLAILLLATPLLAQSPASSDWKARFHAYDRNGDGRIDRAEFQQWMTEAFYFRDKDLKGYLTMDDLQGMMAPETLKAVNLKGDGRLTLPEFLNAAFRDFDAADVNKNGYLSMEEIEAYTHLGK